MASTELIEAEELLATYKAAEIAVLSGAEYRIGSRWLRRVDLSEIRKGKASAQAEVDRLTAGRGRGARVRRVIPRDL